MSHYMKKQEYIKRLEEESRVLRKDKFDGTVDYLIETADTLLKSASLLLKFRLEDKPPSQPNYDQPGLDELARVLKEPAP